MGTVNRLQLWSLGSAMDRFLIVYFSHNFCEHERKLRIVKGFMIIFVSILALKSSLVAVAQPTATAILIKHGISMVTSVLQIIAIVSLYSVIIAKVLISDQQMKTSRHIGNQ